MCETEVHSSTRTRTVQTLHTASWYQTNQQQRVAKKSEANADRARHTPPPLQKVLRPRESFEIPSPAPRERGEAHACAWLCVVEWKRGREGATMISSKQCHAERCSRKRPEQQVTFLLPLSRCTTVLMCVCFLPSWSSLRTVFFLLFSNRVIDLFC